jgi:hypothetical protein
MEPIFWIEEGYVASLLAIGYMKEAMSKIN